MIVLPLFMDQDGFFFLLIGWRKIEKRKMKKGWSQQGKVEGLMKAFSLPFLGFPETFLLECILLTNEPEEETELTWTMWEGAVAKEAWKDRKQHESISPTPEFFKIKWAWNFDNLMQMFTWTSGVKRKKKGPFQAKGALCNLNH